jgi:hypothetical protein
VPFFYFSSLNSLIFKGARCGVNVAKPRQRAVNIAYSPYFEELRLNFISVSSSLLPNAKYLLQTNWPGIEHGQECQLFINRGGIT